MPLMLAASPIAISVFCISYPLDTSVRLPRQIVSGRNIETTAAYDLVWAKQIANGREPTPHVNQSAEWKQ